MTTNLLNPEQRRLGAVALLLGIVLWCISITASPGSVLLALAVGWLIYLFAQSAVLAHTQGHAVELTSEQFPDIYAQWITCCEKLKIQTPPRIYLVRGTRFLHTFSVPFFKKTRVLVRSDVFDSLDHETDAVRFYLGHVLGRLHTEQNLLLAFLRWPALLLPLLGAAYARARENSCDRYGRACCASPEAAVRALLGCSSVGQPWQHLNVAKYIEQLAHTRGFWASFHELIADSGWSVKRAAFLMDAPLAPAARNPFAYLLALGVPYFGRLSLGLRCLLSLYLVFLALTVMALLFPSYAARLYVNPQRMQLNHAIEASQPARDAVASYYQLYQRMPESLESVGVRPRLMDGSTMLLDTKRNTFNLATSQGSIIFTASLDPQGRLTWSCTAGQGINPNALPDTCQP